MSDYNKLFWNSFILAVITGLSLFGDRLMANAMIVEDTGFWLSFGATALQGIIIILAYWIWYLSLHCKAAHVVGLRAKKALADRLARRILPWSFVITLLICVLGILASFMGWIFQDVPLFSLSQFFVFVFGNIFSYLFMTRPFGYPYSIH